MGGIRKRMPPPPERSTAVAQDRQWLVDVLRQLGYQEAADDAARELPDKVSLKEMEDFGDRHGIGRDELVNRMGGSP
jgi:hypothetical protein